MSMDCETARGRMEEREPDAALAAHLATCPMCARDAVFVRRLAAAVAAMPRERAPEALLRGVMAAVEAESLAVGAGGAPELSLRPWELGGVALLSSLLLALIPLALSFGVLPPVVAGTWTGFSRWVVEAWWAMGAAASGLWRDAGQVLSEGWGGFSDQRIASGPWLSWFYGAAAFALALYLLLTWRPAEPAEDAHA
jgi:hypothetical protein